MNNKVDKLKNILDAEIKLRTNGKLLGFESEKVRLEFTQYILNIVNIIFKDEN